MISALSNPQKMPRSGTSVPLDRPLLANRSYIAKHNRNSAEKDQQTTSSQETLPKSQTLKQPSHSKVELSHHKQRFGGKNNASGAYIDANSTSILDASEVGHQTINSTSEVN